MFSLPRGSIPSPRICYLLALTFFVYCQEEDENVGEVALCEGRCTESYFPGKPCYCNGACDQYENCCVDYYTACMPDFLWSDEWVINNDTNNEYKYFDNATMTSREAVDACAKQGALLLSINNEDEQTFVAIRVLRKRTLAAFIGGSDAMAEGTWLWPDRSSMALPTDRWHHWYEGEPDDSNGLQDCSVISNYRFWSIRKLILPSYVWLDYSCHSNPQEVQGYVCERTLACRDEPCLNGGLCQYIGGDEDFTCICPQNFLGRLCEFPWKPEDIWTQCGNTDIQVGEEVTYLTSPLYPKNYPPNTRCRWLLTAPSQKTISISLLHIDIELGKDCAFDRLMIFDGNSRNSTQLLPASCFSSDQVTSMLTTGNEALVVFESDHSVNLTGFELSFSQQECGLGTGNSGCGTKRTFTSTCGSIVVQNGPEAEVCEWFINVPEGFIINMTFTEFSIFDYGVSCDTSYLAVYDGKTESESLLGRFCGMRFPWFLTSSSNTMSLRLETDKWSEGHHVIKMDFETVEADAWQVLTQPVQLSGKSGSISKSSSPVHVRTVAFEFYKYHMRVDFMSKLQLTWTLSSRRFSNLQVYGGASEFSELLLDINSGNGELVSPSFQVLIVVKAALGDDSLEFEFTYNTQEWIPDLSGCYRPLYYNRSDSIGTENEITSPMSPNVIMVSDTQGYSQGLHCKWFLKGTDTLAVRLMGGDIPPNYDNCSYDGMVIYERQTRYGPFCGRSLSLGDLDIKSSELTVVFYSDSRGGTRQGVLRMLLTVPDAQNCPIYDMVTSVAATRRVDCGVVLSPGFPQVVGPGLWTWLFEGSPDMYFNIYVYYVRGPDLASTDVTADVSCNEYFQILEISKDATKLRQYEAHLIKICAVTDLFVPPTEIKAPPHQKIEVSLNTLTSSIPQRWEFKLSFTMKKMKKPKNIEAEKTPACPKEYHYYNGNCYRYYQWVMRHYRPEDYRFQQSWQRALDQCKSENATLLTLHSQEETDYIQYMMANEWFWDPAGTYQVNHRLIFLGLSNKYGYYEWNDGSQLGYSDWYTPPESWDTPTVNIDTIEEDILALKYPQPNANVGSLCTVMVLNSPFKSTNWAKIPCDYPIFRSGMICKKLAEGSDKKDVSALANFQRQIKDQFSSGIEACSQNWTMISKKCLRMESNYTAIRKGASGYHMTYQDAGDICRKLKGQVAIIPDKLFETLKLHFDIWRHKPNYGAIYIQNEEKKCAVISATRNHRQDIEIIYAINNCSDSDQPVYNVLCEARPVVKKETCREDQFQCNNGVCISHDFKCDGQPDCGDDSDETECDCGPQRLQCADGSSCISMSLFCDFVQHCPDNSDEADCVRETCSADQFRCKNEECIPLVKKCDFRIDCSDASDESEFTCDGQCKGFLCYSGTCLRPDLQGDIITDCPGFSLEDEAEIPAEQLTLFDVYHLGEKANQTEYIGCDDANSVQCRLDYKHCYHRDEACYYDNEIVNEARSTTVLKSCRDGSHLRVHCGDTECPGKFKCPDSYCIAVKNVCDGIQDCPGGHDERGCHNYTCPGQLKCKDESQCISQDHVCDGKIHCRSHREDEKYCRSMDYLCDTCVCQGLIADCSNSSLISLPNTLSDQTRNIRALILSSNSISSVSFPKLHWLGRLLLDHNNLTQILPGVFDDLVNLFELDLSNNQLTSLPRGVFSELTHLKKLDLSNNRLELLHKETFYGLGTLDHLLIFNNDLHDIEQNAFDHLVSLSQLESDAYKFCCIAEHVQRCTPEADEFSSCKDLMANGTLQICIWALGTVAFFGNIFVIIWRVLTERAKVSSFFIINLGVSDFLMGVYLLTIASVDVYYRGIYIIHADRWRGSGLCQFAGIIAMLGSEASVFMLTAITVDRAISILFPLKDWQIRMSQARIIAASIWAFCFFISILPTFDSGYFGDAFFGRTGVCLPFQVSNQRLAGWEYSVLIFLCVNLISFLLIFILYVAIYGAVRASMKEMSQMGQTNSNSNELALAKKLALIVVTDFVCWVPIILVGFAALGGAYIPPEMSAWIAVFILPLNSAANPLLYTISAIDCSSRSKKKRPNHSTITSGGTKQTGVSDTSLSTIDSNKK